MSRQRAIPCRELLARYEHLHSVRSTQKLNFSGVDGCDVYNITPPFEDEGRMLLAGRVEQRDTEVSCVRFFERRSETEFSVLDGPVLNRVQDPFVTRVDGELVLGGTQIDLDPLNERSIINWRTIFVRGGSLRDLKFWFTGPNRMKDIRLFDLSPGELLVLTRPQGGAAGMGKIGMVVVDKGRPPAEDVLQDAPLFSCHFVDGEWGGANQLFRLKNGLVGVLGHIAYLERRENLHIRHYHSMVFTLDVHKRSCSEVKIIAARRDFAGGAYKREDIADVLFAGGLVRRGDGSAQLYTGVSDCEAHMAVIADPFAEYEV